MNEGDLFALVTLVVVVGLVTLALVLQAQTNRKRLEVARAAIEANQPEVAQALLATKWSHVALQGLKMAAVGLALALAGTVRPELAGLLLVGSVILVAAVPIAIYAAVREHYPQPAGAACLTVGIIVFCVAALAYVGWWVVGGVGMNARANTMQQQLQSVAASQEFGQRVQRLTGSPVGTAHPLIDGHRAEPLLTGMPYGNQSCGSPFHDRIRFSTIRTGFLNVYYLPDVEEYLIIGEARVDPAGIVVTDGYVSAKQALQPPTGGARAP